MGVTAFRSWPLVDQILALALQEYEDGVCSGCGQPLAESMDPDLEDEWATLPAHRCHSCTAIARAAEQDKDREYPGALRYVTALLEGYQERRDSARRRRAERAAASQPDHE